MLQRTFVFSMESGKGGGKKFKWTCPEGWTQSHSFYHGEGKKGKKTPGGPSLGERFFPEKEEKAIPSWKEGRRGEKKIIGIFFSQRESRTKRTKPINCQKKGCDFCKKEEEGETGGLEPGRPRNKKNQIRRRRGGVVPLSA